MILSSYLEIIWISPFWFLHNINLKFSAWLLLAGLNALVYNGQSDWVGGGQCNFGAMTSEKPVRELRHSCWGMQMLINWWIRRSFSDVGCNEHPVLTFLAVTSFSHTVVEAFDYADI